MLSLLVSRAYYTEAKVVQIHDPVIATSKIVLSLSLFLAYVIIYQCFYQHAYMTYETPIAATNIWLGRPPPPAAASTPFAEFSYCNNPIYNWGSTVLTLEELESLGMAGYNLGGPTGWNCTRFDYNAHVSVGRPTNEVYVTIGSYSYGSDSSLKVGFSDAGISMMHVIRLPWDTKGRSNIRSRFLDSKGNLIQEFPQGDYVTFTFQQLIDASGISLSDFNIQPQLPMYKQPRYQMTGAIFVVDMRYSNARPFEAVSDLCEIKVHVMESAWGFLGVTDNPVVINSGLVFSFKASGAIGKFEFSEVFSLVVQSTVIFTLSSFLVLLLRIALKRDPPELMERLKEKVHTVGVLKATSELMRKQKSSGKTMVNVKSALHVTSEPARTDS